MRRPIELENGRIRGTHTIHCKAVLVGLPCVGRKAARIKHCTKGEAATRGVRRHPGVRHIEKGSVIFLCHTTRQVTVAWRSHHRRWRGALVLSTGQGNGVSTNDRSLQKGGKLT